MVAHVRGAIDFGINFFDTAEWYGTEAVVGKAIAGAARDHVVISTKKNIVPEDHPDPESEIRRSLEQSLRTLGTDYVDVYHVHGAEPKDYANAGAPFTGMLSCATKANCRLSGSRSASWSTRRMPWSSARCAITFGT